MVRLTTLVIGTAPGPYVRECLKNIESRGKNNIVVLSRYDRIWLLDHGYRTYIFNEFVSWKNPTLLWAMLRHNPAEVIVVCGADYTHGKVIHSVALLKALRMSKMTIKVYWKNSLARVDPLIEWMTFSYDNPETAVATLCIIMILAVGLLGFMGWIGFLILVLILTIEMLLLTTAPQRQALRHRHPRHLLLECRTIRRDSCLPVFRFQKPDVTAGWFNHPHLQLRELVEVPLLHHTREIVYRTDACGRRLTAPTSSADNKPTIAIFGCSLTFGIGVNEENTFPWLLQTRMSSHRILNYGCIGYSLYQSLLMLEQTIGIDKPELVVIGFHPGLASRNTNSLSQSYNVGFANPSCLWKNGKLRRYPPRGYFRVFLSEESTLLYAVEIIINRFQTAGRDNPKTMLETCQQVLLEINKCCAAHQSKLLVVCLDEASEYYEFLEHQEFSWCDTGVALKDSCRWTLLPFDPHPNADAHRRYADTIEAAIKESPKGGRIMQKLEKKGSSSNSGTDFIYPLF